MLKHLKQFSFFILITVAGFGCKNTTEPEIDNTQPGRRDYEWRVDTVKLQGGFFTKIWGSSPSDVWAVGNVDANENIWHYDGFKWSSDGVLRAENPWSIFGLGPSSIWMAGSEKKIWFYDGISWQVQANITLNEFSRIYIHDIWGKNSNSLYAVGSGYNENGEQNGLILKYNGIEWKYLRTDIEPIVLMEIREYNGRLFVSGEQNNSAIEDTSKLFLLNDNNQLQLVNSNTHSVGLELINDILYVIIEKNIYKFSRTGLVHWKTFDVENSGFRIWGRNEKDIFLRMQDGVAHYNGSNIEYIYKFNTQNYLTITGAAIFSDTIFFLITDYTSHLNLILKGTLPNYTSIKKGTK